MDYKFILTNARRIQNANRLLLKTPQLHATRNLDVHDFIYMIDGEWEIALGKESFLMKPNDVLFLPANVTHRGVSLCTPNTELIYLHIYPENGDGEANTVSDTSEHLIINNFLHTKASPQISLLFRRLMQVKNNEALAGAYANTLLYELSAISQNKDNVTLARQIRDYLIQSTEIKSNNDIAAHFYLSQRTVETIFKQAYGMSMHQYAIRHKLECAKQYLSDYPNITLCEIAQMLNFCDEHHLSRMFKKTFGVSPREYKRLNRQTLR